MNLRVWVPFVRALLARPDLWAEGIAASVALAPSGWWRRRPWLPLPDPSYWRFRMETAYGGDGGQRPDVHDVIEYLEWRKRRRRRLARVLR